MKTKLYILTFFPFVLAGLGLFSLFNFIVKVDAIYQVLIGLVIGLVLWIVETNVIYTMCKKWAIEDTE